MKKREPGAQRYGPVTPAELDGRRATLRATLSVILAVTSIVAILPELLRQSIFEGVSSLAAVVTGSVPLLVSPFLQRLGVASLLILVAIAIDSRTIRSSIPKLRRGWLADESLMLMSVVLLAAAAAFAASIALVASAPWMAAAAGVVAFSAVERAVRLRRASKLAKISPPALHEAKAKIEVKAFRREASARLLLLALAVGGAVAVFFATTSIPFALAAAASALMAGGVALSLPIEGALTLLLVRAGEASAQVRSRRMLESLAAANEILFDDTAVLERSPHITDYVLLHGTSHRDLLGIAALTLGSNGDLVSRSIVARAGDAASNMRAVDRKTTPIGSEAIVSGKRVLVARHDLVPKDIDTSTIHDDAERYAADGKRVVIVARDRQVIGAIALIDNVIPDAAEAIALLRKAGMRTSVLLEESESAAAFRAAQLQVDEMVSGKDAKEREHALARVREGHAIIVADHTGSDLFKSAPLTVCVGGSSDTAMTVGRRALTPVAALLLDARDVMAKSRRRLLRDPFVRIVVAALAAAATIPAGAAAPVVGALVSLLITARLERPSTTPTR